VEGQGLSEAALVVLLGVPGEQVRSNLLDLTKEGFLRESEGGYTIA
jgi:hypothetical protein